MKLELAGVFGGWFSCGGALLGIVFGATALLVVHHSHQVVAAFLERLPAALVKVRCLVDRDILATCLVLFDGAEKGV